MHNLLKTVVEVTVDDKVHDAIEYQQEVVHRCGTKEPDWRQEAVSTGNDFINIEHLIQVQQKPWDVCHNEHADNTDQNQRKLQVFGLHGFKQQSNNVITFDIVM